MIGSLNSAWVHGRDEEAIGIAESIIQMNDYILEPYEILGVIYSKLGDVKRCYTSKRLAANIK